MHAVPLEKLAGIEEELALGMIERFGLDTSSVALDMTNFATFIDTGNDAAPIAQRGKAKQKRADLRLVGLGLVVTRAGGIPLLSHAYPGNKPFRHPVPGDDQNTLGPARRRGGRGRRHGNADDGGL